MEKQTDKTGDFAEGITQSSQDATVKEHGAEKEESGAPPKGEQEDKNFLELYEESLKSIQEGGLVRGEIVQIDKEFVLVDIGYKSEGHIPIGEFIDAEG